MNNHFHLQQKNLLCPLDWSCMDLRACVNIMTEMENVTLYRLHCWKSSVISQSILIVRCSTVNYCLYISVQSLSKQNSRTSRRDSSDTGDDRTPGEEIVGVCNGQQMAVSNRARDPRLTQSCITQWHILCFACDFFLLVLRADMLLVYIWFLLLCKKKKGSWPNVKLKRMVFRPLAYFQCIVLCVCCMMWKSYISNHPHIYDLWNSSVESDEICCWRVYIKRLQSRFHFPFYCPGVIHT
jgi:hypothetical protein